ncbi:hypothetical protein JCM10914A_42630 [Paenibacillus sp. JCM 10914]|nr:hypothetical protein JCM10914_1584 [Paenibacillus sp. JCM 10914]
MYINSQIMLWLKSFPFSLVHKLPIPSYDMMVIMSKITEGEGDGSAFILDMARISNG